MKKIMLFALGILLFVAGVLLIFKFIMIAPLWAKTLVGGIILAKIGYALFVSSL